MELAIEIARQKGIGVTFVDSADLCGWEPTAIACSRSSGTCCSTR